jgi:uncharacterized membrane protein HdeD (DUF308 family)
MNASSKQDFDRGIEMRPEEIGANRSWFAVLGAVLIVLGAIAVVAAFAATLATVLLFGVLLFLAGVAQVVNAATHAGRPGFGLHLTAGILYAVIGGLLVIDPVGGAVSLTLLLAALFLIAGIGRIVLGFQAQSPWFTFSGAIDLLLGVLILVGWPETGTWVIGLFVGIEMIFAGISMLFFHSVVRRAKMMDV